MELHKATSLLNWFWHNFLYPKQDCWPTFLPFSPQGFQIFFKFNLFLHFIQLCKSPGPSLASPCTLTYAWRGTLVQSMSSDVLPQLWKCFYAAVRAHQLEHTQRRVGKSNSQRTVMKHHRASCSPMNSINAQKQTIVFIVTTQFSSRKMQF